MIDAFGGTAATAQLCEVRMPSVSEWRRNGIPRARLLFLKLARPDLFASLGAHDNSSSPPIDA
ncbi:hypothetical protein DPV79_05230 [Burkholderia reimsis]|uniref:Rha family transcriptional regulator n=1 Tax=Burkholderia reimsis TaxID=2234132 RepID=A0A365R169_9BURK|nr:hypothetical protein [Burkholderia reimsis]RBB42002.1 hypothetical protein DPV79_05230 [Burkholderia reimsis]